MGVRVRDGREAHRRYRCLATRGCNVEAEFSDCLCGCSAVVLMLSVFVEMSYSAILWVRRHS